MPTHGRIDIAARDYDLLVSLVEYVIGRYEETDVTMVEFLREGLNEVQMHQSADSGGEETMDQISDVLDLLGDPDLERSRTPGSRSEE